VGSRARAWRVRAPSPPARSTASSTYTWLTAGVRWDLFARACLSVGARVLACTGDSSMEAGGPAAAPAAAPAAVPAVVPAAAPAAPPAARAGTGATEGAAFDTQPATVPRPASAAPEAVLAGAPAGASEYARVIPLVRARVARAPCACSSHAARATDRARSLSSRRSRSTTSLRPFV